ncbi:MAG: threonylcarbamoyl-AMP synthase [Oscillospiraceae bacterium]|jgi:L-threonylcarbamoyladenylate synthase|nr:threonylcarbamoyl-AMP synthase [Oscillospiraceae bacterium]
MIVGTDDAVRLLQGGNAVAIPTETVYGLACVLTAQAAEKVFALKGRPKDNPFIVHIARLEDISSVARDVPQCAYALAGAFWPGPLTIVLPKAKCVPLAVTAGLDTVAVRCPAHPAAREIIEKTGPLAAPSANISGRPSPVSAAHVLADFDVPVVDGGECEVGLESTVVSLCGEAPRLLRPGAVTPDMLRGVLGTLELDASLLSGVSAGTPPSPGMKYRHYAPKMPLAVLHGRAEDAARFVRERGAGALVGAEEAALFSGLPNVVYTPQGLFGALRRVDALAVDTVYVRVPPPQGIGLAVCNRLYKAAGYKEVRV